MKIRIAIVFCALAVLSLMRTILLVRSAQQAESAAAAADVWTAPEAWAYAYELWGDMQIACFITLAFAVLSLFTVSVSD